MGRPIDTSNKARRAVLPPRQCQRKGCHVWFTPRPGATTAKYHSDRCRALIARAQQHEANRRRQAERAASTPRTAHGGPGQTERPPHPLVVAADQAEQRIRERPASAWGDALIAIQVELERTHSVAFAGFVAFALRERLQHAEPKRCRGCQAIYWGLGLCHSCKAHKRKVA